LQKQFEHKTSVNSFFVRFSELEKNLYNLPNNVQIEAFCNFEGFGVWKM